VDEAAAGAVWTGASLGVRPADLQAQESCSALGKCGAPEHPGPQMVFCDIDEGGGSKVKEWDGGGCKCKASNL